MILRGGKGKMNANKFRWTTKDGRELKLKDIDNHHLLNILKMLRRQKKEGATRIRGFIFGNEVDAWEEEIWNDDEEETLRTIRKEFKKRGLKEAT